MYSMMLMMMSPLRRMSSLLALGSSVRYLGTSASLTEKCKKGESSQKVIEYVRDMLSFNAGLADSDASD